MPEADFSRIPVDDPEDTEIDDPLTLMDFTEAEGPLARRREGLPPAYRMRHPKHYVEQLMGDAPIQTVKQIAIGDVHGHPGPDRDLTELTESIRQFGILQPILVSREAAGEGYRVIAGGNRMAAARLAGLPTVPCLVMEADEGQLEGLRQQASRRAVAASPPMPTPAEAPVPAGPQDATAPLLRLAFREISSLLGCLTTLVPLAADEEHATFRGSVLRDLMMVEADRATTIAAAAALLSRGPDGEAAGDEFVDCRDVLLRLREKVSVAARLKGVHLAWPRDAPSAQIRGQFQGLVTAWSGLLYACLEQALQGDRLSVVLEVPKVRPAAIFRVQLDRHTGETLTAEAGEAGPRRENPATAVLIGAAERCARQHGGRFAPEQDGRPGGVFVIPLPVD